MRKSTIETALSDYNAALDDAARAFQVRRHSARKEQYGAHLHGNQIATLINIHLAVGEATTPENRKNRSKLSVRTRPGETSDSASLPAYSMVRGESADAQELLTDAGELTMSPRSRSGTVSAPYLALPSGCRLMRHSGICVRIGRSILPLRPEYQ